MNTFGAPALVRVSQEFHRVRSPAELLRVPEHPPLGLDVFLDQAADDRSERAHLVASDPDEEPVGALDARREGRADAGPGAHADAAFVQCGGIGHAGEL